MSYFLCAIILHLEKKIVQCAYFLPYVFFKYIITAYWYHSEIRYSPLKSY